jgi:predicted amidohydrolase YtcJ
LWDFGDLYLDVVGADRSNAAYPMRAFIDAGLTPVASSDAPVCSFDPFPNLAAMLTRQSRRGAVLGAAQAITLDEALSCMTANGARAEFMEDRKGLLALGHYADIAVWDHDPFTVDADRIRQGKVVATILDGRVVHDTIGIA